MKRKKTNKTTRKRVRRDKKHVKTFVYLLQSGSNEKKTYVGATNNLKRRLAQHNGHLKGGARYTKAYRPWAFHAVFALDNRHDALSLEWKSKHRKVKSDGAGVAGKVNTISRLSCTYANAERVI